MQNTSGTGRHRKPSPARAIAARAAVSAAGATAALLVAAGTATAGTTAGVAPGAVAEGMTPVAEGPCTNTPLDSVIGPLAQTNCNDPAPASPDDVTGDDPTEQGSGSGEGDRTGEPAAPGVPFPQGGDNPPGA